MQPAAQRMSDGWVSLEQSNGVLDGIDQRPVEGEKQLPRARSARPAAMAARVAGSERISSVSSSASYSSMGTSAAAGLPLRVTIALLSTLVVARRAFTVTSASDDLRRALEASSRRERR